MQSAKVTSKMSYVSILAIVVCATGGLSASAYAEPKNKGKGQGYYERPYYNGDNEYRSSKSRSDDRYDGREYRNEYRNEYRRGDDSDDRGNERRETRRFQENDRKIIRQYMQERGHKMCPPGLAKKNNNCLPPGHARHYEIGKRLAPDVSYVDVPYELRRHLAPAPYGYKYVRVDNDVLLMSKDDRTIMDVVTLMSDMMMGR